MKTVNFYTFWWVSKSTVVISAVCVFLFTVRRGLSHPRHAVARSSYERPTGSTTHTFFPIFSIHY